MSILITLALIVVAVLAILTLPPALKKKSWKQLPANSILSFFGIVLPLFFFVFSIFLVPDSKDDCHDGWIDCFHLGKLALTPFVFWAASALYVVEIYEVLDRTRPWIVQGLFIGAVISSVCLVFGFVVHGTDATLLPWLAVPLYTSIWYVIRAVQIIRDERVKSLTLVKVLVGSAPFWAASVVWSYKTYLSLPDHSPDCFVVTAASRGHRKFVGPFLEVPHRGQRRLANQQLLTLWQFEALWRSHAPRSHTMFRRGYNVIGPIIARRITTPFVADTLYVALKPAELLAWLVISVMMLHQQPRTLKILNSK